MKNLLLTLSAVFALNASAFAHANFVDPQVKNESYSRLVLKIPHGCGDEPTTALKVYLPDGLYMAKPIWDKNYQITTGEGEYITPAKIWGKDQTKGVRTITWSDFNAPANMVAEFGFYAYVKTPATKLLVKIEQICTSKSIIWEEENHSKPNPAAVLKISQ